MKLNWNSFMWFRKLNNWKKVIIINLFARTWRIETKSERDDPNSTITVRTISSTSNIVYCYWKWIENQLIANRSAIVNEWELRVEKCIELRVGSQIKTNKENNDYLAIRLN